MCRVYIARHRTGRSLFAFYILHPLYLIGAHLFWWTSSFWCIQRVISRAALAARCRMHTRGKSSGRTDRPSQVNFRQRKADRTRQQAYEEGFAAGRASEAAAEETEEVEVQEEHPWSDPDRGGAPQLRLGERVGRGVQARAARAAGDLCAETSDPHWAQTW